MRRFIAILVVVGGLLISPLSHAQSYTFVFNPNAAGGTVRNITTYSTVIVSSSQLESVFVKARICLFAVCTVEEKRRVNTCPVTPPPAGSSLNVACSALAIFESPTDECTYCGAALWRETYNGDPYELEDEDCGVHNAPPGGQH